MQHLRYKFPLFSIPVLRSFQNQGVDNLRFSKVLAWNCNNNIFLLNFPILIDQETISNLSNLFSNVFGTQNFHSSIPVLRFLESRGVDKVYFSEFFVCAEINNTNYIYLIITRNKHAAIHLHLNFQPRISLRPHYPFASSKIEGSIKYIS